ncbi:MAG: hypothetical protein ACHP6H_04355 [Legionellales bacterium]
MKNTSSSKKQKGVVTLEYLILVFFIGGALVTGAGLIGHSIANQEKILAGDIADGGLVSSYKHF